MHASKKTRARAKALRRRMSPPEVLLWGALRKRRPGFPVFRRQHPYDPYVLDFYCDAAKLCIEVDSGWHNGARAQQRDLQRDAHLACAGIDTVRVHAKLIFKSLDEALMRIDDAVMARLRVLRPPPF